MLTGLNYATWYASFFERTFLITMSTSGTFLMPTTLTNLRSQGRTGSGADRTRLRLLARSGSWEPLVTAIDQGHPDPPRRDRDSSA
jgi:hypothetical protein